MEYLVRLMAVGFAEELLVNSLYVGVFVRLSDGQVSVVSIKSRSSQRADIVIVSYARTLDRRRLHSRRGKP